MEPLDWRLRHAFNDYLRKEIVDHIVLRMGTVLRNESYTTLAAQEVHFENLDMQRNPEWRLKHTYTDCLMWGGPRTDSRTVHEVRTYENEGSGLRVSYFKI